MNIKRLHKIYPLLLHSIMVLAISYSIVLCFTLDPQSLSFFGVIDESIDAPMSDMYIHSQKGRVKFEKNITLVSIDSCKNRLEIAKVIEQIDSLNPRVIGLDVFFKNRNQQDPKADNVLENVICKCENLVIACKLKDEQHEDNDKYNTCEHYFFVDQEERHLIEGFVNFDGDGTSTIRTFTPQLYLQKEQSSDTIYNFAAQIAGLYDEKAFKKLLQRKGNLEIIHFQPLWIKKINPIEIEDNPKQITGKIVLIGSLAEDMHKTPIISQMNGIEIHAYIVSAILGAKYIDRLDNVWTRMMNILLCYSFALFCWTATIRLKKGVSILIKLVQVAILFLAFFAGRYLFNHCNIDITYTQTIIVMGVLILIVDIYNVCIVWSSKWMLKRKKINYNGKDDV